METRSLFGSLGSVSAGALLAAALAAPLKGQATERVSVDSLGGEGNSDSVRPSISADGRYVAFQSYATNLVGGDGNGYLDVFVRDRQSGTTERVSVDSLGGEGDGDSGYSSISADGRYVAFLSLANLVGGDTNGFGDVFVRDRQSGTTERVSVDSLGGEGNSDSYGSSISADGRYVAFQSSATNLVGGDTNGVDDSFVRDRQNGRTERVSVDSLGVEGNSDSYDSSISANGRYVAFQSYATNLVNGDGNGRQDVFLRDRNCGSAAMSATFYGDGVNADAIAPLNAVLGSSWSAPLSIGHPHGAGGPLSLKVRSATINGPNFVSPIGGRLTEVLIAGQFLATLAGSHDGVSGDVPPQTVPNRVSLVGVDWAAQYTVVGGGFGDLSQAVFGVVGCQ